MRVLFVLGAILWAIIAWNVFQQAQWRQSLPKQGDYILDMGDGYTVEFPKDVGSVNSLTVRIR